MKEFADPREPESARPKFTNAVRTANRRRHVDRPDEPKDIQSEIDTDFLDRHTWDTFYRGDVKVGRHRHLIFASDQLLKHLSRAKTWFIDGTFKVVSKPFVQLLSIHIFTRSGEDMKQLPGIFVLMSRKRIKDDKEVLAEITNLLPSPPVAELLVADFEDGLWRGAKLVFSEMRIHGCAFHWGQAVWRHVQEFGLKIDYTKLDNTHKLIRKLPALPSRGTDSANSLRNEGNDRNHSTTEPPL